jgi:hypothetical protein
MLGYLFGLSLAFSLAYKLKKHLNMCFFGFCVLEAKILDHKSLGTFLAYKPKPKFTGRPNKQTA